MNPKPSCCRVLFVCLGNICRSPAAEIIFRKLVADAGRSDDFEIDSAGTLGAHQGAPPDSRMSASLHKKGYTITGNARKIQTDDLKKFDYIITMDESNLSQVQSMDSSGEWHSKIQPMVNFCKRHTDLGVPDPYYGGQAGFTHVIELLEDGCEGLFAACENYLNAPTVAK